MKKRILIVNKFYYRRGGDCVYSLNLEALLKSHGHDVAVFAMEYPDNLHSHWSEYFASKIDFKNNQIKALKRIFGFGDIRQSFMRILNEFHPDIVHLNNIHSYLSPVIAKIASEYGAKVVWTLHDYKLICPSYSCLNRGRICELCFHDSFAVVRNRCMKDSFFASILAYAEQKIWNKECLSKWTNVFICPSRFMAVKMEEGGFPKDKLYHICNFVSTEMSEYYSDHKAKTERKDYYCYVGRLSKEKGIRNLLNVASRLPYELRIAGSGPLESELLMEYSSYKNIKFMGQLPFEKVLTLLSETRFSVVPSEWHENNPYSIIESLCCGTPFVGANIGGIPELANQGNSLIYTIDNNDNLEASIKRAWRQKWDYSKIQKNALEKFSPDRYYAELSSIYNK